MIVTLTLLKLSVQSAESNAISSNVHHASYVTEVMLILRFLSSATTLESKVYCFNLVSMVWLHFSMSGKQVTKMNALWLTTI